METNNECKYLDTELLQGYFDSLGKSVVEKMFALYCQQVTIYLNNISDAQRADDANEWAVHCHKMKGAAASVGLLQLHGKLKLMETTTVDKQQKELLLNDIISDNEQSILAFKAWLNAR